MRALTSAQATTLKPALGSPAADFEISICKMSVCLSSQLRPPDDNHRHSKLNTACHVACQSVRILKLKYSVLVRFQEDEYLDFFPHRCVKTPR